MGVLSCMETGEPPRSPEPTATRESCQGCREPAKYKKGKVGTLLPSLTFRDTLLSYRRGPSCRAERVSMLLGRSIM